MISLHTRWLLSCLAVLGALLPSLAAACGLPFQARISAEQALIIHTNGRQHMITSVQLEDAGDRAAVVFPVPGVPEVDQPPGGEELFAYLDEATQPLEQVVRRVVWRASAPDETAPAGTRAVQVLGRDLIGGYDVARLAADDPPALRNWLAANDYVLPASAQPILAAYVAEEWNFVAVKLADQPAAAGALAPLRMSFDADEVVYPMRLGALSDQPLDVQIYVLADQRVTIDPLETLYAGPVEQLSPAPPVTLAPLFNQATYLTRLRATAIDPRSLMTDFVARPVPGNEPYREVKTVYQDVPLLQQYGLLTALFCLVLLNIIAIVGAIGLKRRFDAISPEAESR